ncbi:2-keto-4-pentenoate hydratase [Thermomonospora echinospora]|uniref:2-keto-4-pentenoate hydratase n=1 Tax=Thermomonospora echinospora TaxID=1992 RepID=A0A1H6D791_9ACTN|nr:2-keto-4-pentenoate hydratase [Thermomonospora echinospora]SEG81277.1 2-keto-4-pentenoate hydratase [Thermomonospora echinospora]
MRTSEIREAAAALLDAHRSGTPIPPLSMTYPSATIADAYRIQQEQVRFWTEAGDRVRGHKIGLVSAVIQRQMGVHEPDYGHLTASMFHPEHRPIPAGAFLQPRIEPEIAFVLGAPLRGPGVTVDDAGRAVRYLLPALEIVDSRIRDWKITIVDTIADNASSGAAILGSTPIDPAEVDLPSVSCALLRNGTVIETGTGAAVLGTPFNALAWLANAIGALGVSLEPGQVVLSGSITRAIAIAPGDSIMAEFPGIGRVTAMLAEDDPS